MTAIVTLATGKGPMELHLHVGGLVNSSKEHLRWFGEPLHVGDEVQVKLVDATSVDEPRTRERPDPAKDLRAQKKYVRAVVKQLGWKIQTNPKQLKGRSRGK
jgi:hypothetical protein